MENNEVTLIKTEIVNNHAPDHLQRLGEYTVTEKSATGLELLSFLIKDPLRVRIFGDENNRPETFFRESADFTIIVPFLDDLQEIEITKTSSGEVVHNVDLSDTILEFCQKVGYEGSQCARFDQDADGVPDETDRCIHSIMDSNVIIEDCDSGVKNSLMNEGCTMSDLIAMCPDGAENHGDFVSCVTHLSNAWVGDGIIHGKENGAIQACAANPVQP
jgi:hypothetical protein